MRFTSHAIDAMDKSYRTLLINSLSGFKSANLVGTSDEGGQHNLSMVSSVFHLGAHPPLVGMIIRPASVPRHTLENIIATECYTVNHVHPAMLQPAHQTAARYDRAVSEFDAVGLSPQLSALHAAPYVAESRLKFGVKLCSQQEIQLNHTVLVIGEIIEVILQDDVIQPDGYIDIEALQTVAVSGLDSYHCSRRITRLSYAKPDKALTALALDGSPLRGTAGHEA